MVTIISSLFTAIQLNPNYIRAILRRAELYEKTDKLDEALEDYKSILEKDPSVHQAREACMVSLIILCVCLFCFFRSTPAALSDAQSGGSVGTANCWTPQPQQRRVQQHLQHIPQLSAGSLTH